MTSQQARKRRSRAGGFRNTPKSDNQGLYDLLAGIERELTAKDITSREVKIFDPSKISLKIVEQHAVEKAKLPRKFPNKIENVKKHVIAGLGSMPLHPSGLHLNFSNLIPLGQTASNGFRRKRGLALAEGPNTELVFDMHQLCMAAFKIRGGVQGIAFPDGEWVPHVTLFELRTKDPDIATIAGKVATGLISEIENIGINFNHLEYYSGGGESMVDPMAGDF